MRTLREPMARSIPDFATRRALWYEIVDSRALELLEDGKPEEARAVIAQLLARHGVRLPGEFQQPE
jgi:siroheme synthase (precorrin-2 oxidase/ferrochelatase)